MVWLAVIMVIPGIAMVLIIVHWGFVGRIQRTFAVHKTLNMRVRDSVILQMCAITIVINQLAILGEEIK
jgi:uncharacterized membrane protein